MSLIQNPILRGFNADPSIIRVEDTYYIANSQSGADRRAPALEEGIQRP
ncbi:family 43 glycosylhydrolase, partial [Klebsiella pneumoniae]